jgi:hypothetical protein
MDRNYEETKDLSRKELPERYKNRGQTAQNQTSDLRHQTSDEMKHYIIPLQITSTFYCSIVP